jgi:hypothetical protein
MNIVKLVGCCAALSFLVNRIAFASETEEVSATNRVLSFIPYVKNNPCVEPYWQLAASPPLQGTSDGGEGYPWRVLLGYCVAQSGRLFLHQDWALSYFDATPQGNASGGEGISFGTDFSFQWRHTQGALFTPYYELGGGIQYAAGTPFPAHGSRWTFTINAGAGFLIPLKPNLRLNTAIRYMHISNAGLLPENAGYDAFHMVVGVRW